MSAIDTYNDAVEAVWDRFDGRIMAFLHAVRAMLIKNHGWIGNEPHMMDLDDERWWSMLLFEPGEGSVDEDGIDVTIEIIDGAGYDGGPVGIAIGIKLVRYSGTVLGVFQPYNFTESCWVDPTNDDAIARRFDLVLNEGMVRQAVDYLMENA